MFANQHVNHPAAKSYRQQFKLAAKRAGAEDRIAAAQAKRDRKNAKRARDTRAQETGDTLSRQMLPFGLRRKWAAIARRYQEAA